MKPPEDFSNLFLDMNAFFASVEQQVQPPLRGKPVGVAPYVGHTGCIIAKSYEAKAFGVATGSLVGEARRLCPQIIILPARPELYLFYHKEIVKVLESFSPNLSILSVDEFSLRLSGLDQNFKSALKMAKNIKQAIYDQVGDYLSCSVGIGPNKWLAKVAGERKKPDGLVVLTLKELPALYRSLSLIDLPGINLGLARHLRRRKIKTPFDFYLADLFNLSRWFGHPGRVWFYRLRGYEIDEIKSSTKSISHEHVLAPKYRSLKEARKVLVKLAQKCAFRLRRGNFTAGKLIVTIRFLDRSWFEKNAKINYIYDSQTIQNTALKLYDACFSRKIPLRLGVVLSELSKTTNEQISLFSDFQKSKNLSKALDIINDKYGFETIYPASMFGASDAAPQRISFGNPERF